MPEFTAKIITPAGTREEISAAAESEAAFASRLRADGSIVLSIEMQKPETSNEGMLSVPSWHPSWLLPMTGLDVEFGLLQLSSMSQSGVSLLSALRTVAQQARRPRAARVWLAIHDKICAGSSLSGAMLDEAHIFGDVAIQLVKVGEHSGELDTALRRAAEQMAARRNLRMMLVNALVYPALATVMALAVSVYLVVAVIPKISEFLEQGGATLPPMTQALMEISGWIQKNGLLLVLSIAAIVVGLAIFRKSRYGREFCDSALLKTPVVGKLLRLSGTAIFAKAMSMLVESGVTLLDSLSVTGKLLSNRRMSGRVGEAREKVMRGATLASALHAAPEFMPMLPRMAAIGETTGLLGKAFAEVAEFHELMLAMAIKRFSATIEPLMIIITAAIVGFVYISFFTALFSMANAA